MSSEENPLTGRVALVTGGSRGIGKAAALRLASIGCSVVVNFRSSSGPAQEVVAEIRAGGGKAIVVQADVMSPGEAARLVDTSIGAFGKIDILINNAGIARKEDLLTSSLEHFDEAFKMNLRSAFILSQAVLPEMFSRKWGRLVFLSSIAARQGGIVSAAYASTKAGVEGLMHYYAAHAGDAGITSNAIAPAFIDTDMFRALSGGSERAGGLGSPSQVSDAIELVVRNPFMNGQTIHVNGGRYMT